MIRADSLVEREYPMIRDLEPPSMALMTSNGTAKAESRLGERLPAVALAEAGPAGDAVQQPCAP
jgi:hypothetical protein